MTIHEAFEYTIRKLHSDGMAVKTLRNYRSASNSLLRSVPDIPIQLLTQDNVTKWKEDQLKRANQTSSIARYVSCLKGVLSCMQKLGLDVLDPRLVDRVKVIYNERTWLVPSEIQSMLDVAENPRDKAMLALLFSLGCRPSEMLALNRGDVAGDALTIENKKTGQHYPGFIAPYARKAINEYLATRKDSLRPLFVSGQYRRISLSRFEQILHVIADTAQQEFPEAWREDWNVTPYVLRHSHATDLHINGADMRDIQDALGHKSIMTTQIYTHVPNERKRMVREKYHTKLK